MNTLYLIDTTANNVIISSHRTLEAALSKRYALAVSQHRNDFDGLELVELHQPAKKGTEISRADVSSWVTGEPQECANNDAAAQAEEIAAPMQPVEASDIPSQIRVVTEALGVDASSVALLLQVTASQIKAGKHGVAAIVAADEQIQGMFESARRDPDAFAQAVYHQLKAA